MANWSELPDDAIMHITSFLPLPDYIRFSGVCRSWSTVAKRQHCSPARQLPWLLLSNSVEAETRSLYNLSEQKLYNLNLPNMSGRHCCGSTHGWLVTIGEEYDIQLANPFSGALLQLPRMLPYFVDFGANPFFPEWQLDYMEESSEDEEMEDIREMYVHKVVLSADPNTHSDFMVMALYGECRMLAYWRPGQTTWTGIQDYYGRHEDVIWYREKFYAITGSHSILIVDVGAAQPKVERKTVYVDAPLHASRVFYLVELMGALLHVLRYIDDDGDTVEVRLAMVDLDGEKVVPINGIGDYALFLGTNHSMAISALEFPGCESNSIYFTGQVPDSPWMVADLGIYSLTDGTIEPISSGDIFNQDTSPAVWLVPNPW